MKKITKRNNTRQLYQLMKQLMFTLPLLGLFLLAASNVSGQITSDPSSCSSDNNMPTLMPAGTVNGKPSYSCTACTGNGNCDILVSWNGTLWEYDVDCFGSGNPGLVATNTADTNEPPCGANFPWMDVQIGCIDGDVLIGGASCSSNICSGPLDYPDIEVCTGANGSVANFTPLSCDLPTQVDNGDGTLTFVSITYFSPDMATGSALGVLLNSVSLDACAFELGFPVPENLTCEPIVVQFEAVINIVVKDASTGMDISSEPDPECTTEIFTATIYPDPNNYTVTETPGDCNTAPTVSITAVNGDECFSATGTAPAEPACGAADNVEDFSYSFTADSPEDDCFLMFFGTITSTCAGADPSDAAFTCPADVNLCQDALMIDLTPVDNNNAAGVTGVFSGSGAQFVTGNQNPDMGAQIDLTNATPGTYTLVYTTSSMGCPDSVTAGTCSFTTFRSCAADGGSFPSGN